MDKIKEIEEYSRKDYAYFYSSTAKEHVRYLLFYIEELEVQLGQTIIEKQIYERSSLDGDDRIDELKVRVKELEEGIRILINFIPDGWEVPLGWTVIVSQVKKLIEREEKS